MIVDGCLFWKSFFCGYFSNQTLMAFMGDGLGCVILFTDVPKVSKSIQHHTKAITLVINVTIHKWKKHKVSACSNTKNDLHFKTFGTLTHPSDG